LVCNNTGTATKVVTLEEISKMSNNTDSYVDKGNEEQKSVIQQLADANNEIADLKLQIKWLERSYE
jgi:hypothetical protein